MQRRTRAPPSEEGADDVGGNGDSNLENPVRGGVSDEGGGGGQVVQPFLASIFSHLAEAREELESLAAAKAKAKAVKAAGGGLSGGELGGGVSEGGGEQAVRVRLERCLALVRGVIRGAPGIMTPAHCNRGMGLPWEVNVLVKQAKLSGGIGVSGGGGLASNTSSSVSLLSSAPSHAVPSLVAGVGVGVAGMGAVGAASASSSASVPPQDRYVLEVHPLEAVGSLRERVTAASGLSVSADHMRIASTKTHNQDTQTVVEAGVVDGCLIWAIASTNHVAGALPRAQVERSRQDEMLRQKGGATHDGDVIAKQSGPFDELFRLLECAHGLEVSF